MLTILSIIALLLDVAFFILLIHVIMSWLINFNVLNLRQPLVASIWDGLNRLLEPVYRPIRRMLPNTGALDLAPLVAFIVIILAHIYIGSVGMEGAFDAMGSGQVDANWAREHHSLWVEEMEEKGKLSEARQPAE